MGKRTFLFICFYIFISYSGISQSDYLVFKKIPVEAGIGNSANTFLKDKKGFLWIGNHIGLHRFDGYTFKFYVHDLKDSNSIVDNTVNSLAEDSHGNLWIATENGLDKFVVADNRFEHILKNVKIRKILCDKQNKLWIGNSNGIACLDLLNGSYKKFENDPGDPFSVKKGGVVDLTIDQNGDIWFPVWANGLNKYDIKTGKFYNYPHVPNDPSSVYSESIFGLCADNNNGIWFATIFTNKIGRFDIKTGKCSYYEPYAAQRGLNFNSVSKDIAGNIWFTNISKGLFKYDINRRAFINYHFKRNDNDGLVENRTLQFYCDRDGIAWISSLNRGINFCKLNLSAINFFPVPEFDKEDILIFKIFEDEMQVKWILTSKGLLKYNVNTAEFISEIPFNLNFSDPFISGPHNQILKIATDFDSIIVDLSAKTFKKFKPKSIDYGINPKDIIYVNGSHVVWQIDTNIFFSKNGFNQPKVLFHDKDFPDFNLNTAQVMVKNFTGNGDHLFFYQRNLIHFNEHSGKIEYILKKSSDVSNSIRTVFAYGNIIEIIRSNEVVYLNLRTKKTTSFAIKNQSNFEIISVPVKIGEGKFCYSTNKGINIFDIKNQKFIKPIVFGQNRINPDHLFYTKRHTVLVEGMHGILEFNPSEILALPTEKPTFAITDFYLFNRHVPIAKNSVLKQNPAYLKEIVLSHKESVISFEFSVLNYVDDKNDYAYMLQGYENNWNYIGPRKVATYTNLPPGEYLFRAKGKNSNTDYSDEATVKLIIEPAFWQTLWFKILIISLIIGIIYAAFSIRLKIIKRQKAELELKVAIRTEEIRKRNLEILEQRDEILTQNEEIVAQRDEIMARNEQILAQKEELVLKNEQISELYQELTDNIHTAKRIQDAILPDIKFIRSFIPESFVFFSPKDIVSGDFYWFVEKTGKIYMAAVDCTGHGVSGAFMSLIGRTLLNQIVADYTKYNAGELLTALSKELTITLKQNSDEAITKDGMDIALLIIDKVKGEMDFAGANNPLFIIKNGEIEIIKADRTGIGIQRGNIYAVFANNNLNIDHEAEYYIFSDGFIGQFGGENGDEKFKMTRFKEALLGLSTLVYTDREEAIKGKLEEWKGSTPQTDDILVMGLSFSK